MDRSLVQVKQGRFNSIAGQSPATWGCIVRRLAISTARSVTCRGVSRRSPRCVRPWRAGTANPLAGYVGCISRSGGRAIPMRRGSADPIAGPMNLVRHICRFRGGGRLAGPAA